MDKFEKIGTNTSLTIGLPAGLLAIGVGFFLPGMFTGEGLTTMYIFFVYGYSTIGFLISFIWMLWVGGKMIGRDIKNNKGTLKATFNYSAIVNLPSWTVFLLIYILTNDPTDNASELYLPLVAGLISTFLTPLTIGLLIYKVTKMRADKFASA
jgi:hypothetical protein